jgi:hypothetical protein
MQKSPPELLRSRWLPSASLGAALAVLLLGASTPRLAAQSAPQSYNFNNQSDAGWTHFDYGVPPDPNFYYPTNIYSFVTNTAGPAGNYAYRMELPSYTNDPLYHFLPLGGSFLTDMTYGNIGDSTGGRFSAGSDLIAWNTTSDEMEIGLAWSGRIPNWQSPTAYFGGWGPGQKTLGMGVVVNGVTQFGLIGIVTPETTVLLPNHQYRIVASTFDGATWMATIYDAAQPNSPWQSAISHDTSIANFFSDGGGGTVGIMGAILHPMVAPGDFPTQPADATWDNFSVGAIPFVDPAGSVPANMPATVTDLSPTPAAQSAEYFPTISIGFLNRDTGVNSSGNPSGWVKLYLDGVQIPNNQLTIDPNYVYKPHNNDNPGGYAGPQAPYPTNFAGATVSYKLTSIPAPGWHTNTVVFEDDQTISGTNVLHTTTWSWQAAAPSLSLYASNSLPIGSLSVRGFKGRTVVTPGPFDNSLPNAFMVLDYPATNAGAVTLAATNITQLVAWDIGNNGWHWGAVTNYPGLCYPTAYPNYFACQVQAYLRLTNGPHRFHVDSDDGVAIYSGTNPNDTSALLVVADNNGGSVTHKDFDFYVPADGLYPFNIIHEEGNGDAYLCLYEVDLLSGVQRLVNTNGGAVAAFYPGSAWNCTATSTVKANYSPVAFTVTANNTAITTANASGDNSGSCTIMNQTVTSLSGTNTITVTPGSSPAFYRLSGGPGSSKILSCTKSGANLAITYRWQNP